jgi:glycosyltransferase involved in cell wall biosynthesis
VTPTTEEVDVGLTVYRRPTFVREAIDSVLGQTLQRWRLTICENGPGGGEIEAAVQPYLADPRISYAPSRAELPLAQNWTRALSGNAPFVGLLNDDDRWHPGFLQARVKALQAHEECGFAFSPWVLVGADGTVLGEATLPFREGVVSRELLAQRLVRSNVVAVTSVLVRRSALDTAGPSFDGRWHYCDWEMWARLAAFFPAYYLEHHDNDFRRHGTANTFRAREDPAQLVSMLEHIESLFSDHAGVSESWLTRRRNRSRALLNAAGDVFAGGGWKAGGGLYIRALREYPPYVFTHRSLQMIAHTTLGRSTSRAVAGSIRSLLRGG